MESTTAISLELSLEGDSLKGLASDGNGGRREFTGWIGLIAAIEALLTPDPRGGDDK
jgi:hypothetical protein